MISHFDAWVSSRLLVGREINGELPKVSKSFAGICQLISGHALGDRMAPWDGFLQGRPDRDEVVKAIADQNPDSPAPDLDDAGDGWPPLRLRDLPSVESFPVDVLPPAALQLVIEGAEAIGCPRDFLGLPVLAVAGGTIGRSVALKLKNGYFASSTIFAGCIGPPSDGKTPALKIVAAAVRKIDEALETEHARAVEKWKADNAPPASGGAKARPKPPPPPKPRRIDVDDITMEAIPLILADNPRGLVMIRDELSAFLLGMNQFKGGK